MKEYETVIKALRIHSPNIAYGENEIIFTSRNEKKSKTLNIPNELHAIIKQLYNPTVPEHLIELDKILGYLPEIFEAISNMDVADSSPTEKKLKITARKQMFEELLQKHCEHLEPKIRELVSKMNENMKNKLQEMKEKKE